MGVFEQCPWLLILLVVVTIEVWSAVKALIIQFTFRQRSDARKGQARDRASTRSG